MNLINPQFITVYYRFTGTTQEHIGNIHNSGTRVRVRPLTLLLIVLNETRLKINVHHFLWTTGGCYDNRACCVTGGQLSLRC